MQYIRCWPYLQTLSMHKHLGHWSTAPVDIFNLLWCDVFPLSKLEDVLLAVNNLQNATLITKMNG